MLPMIELNRVSTKPAKSNWQGMRPAAVNASETCCSEATTAGVIGTGTAAASLAASSMTPAGSPVPCAHTAAQAAGCLAAQVCACIAKHHLGRGFCCGHDRSFICHYLSLENGTNLPSHRFVVCLPGAFVTFA